MDYRSHILKPQRKTKRAILLKGPSGVGKTHQFRTLVQSGMRGLYAHVGEHYNTLSDVPDLEIWPIEKCDVPLMLSEKKPQQQDFMLLMDYMRTGDHPYDFVYFDSAMNFADELEHYLKYTLRLTGFELWGALGEKMKQALKLLVSLTRPTQARPVHVIVTWGVEVSQDWEGKRSKEPIMSGKYLRPRISYLFDDVFMLGKQPDPDGQMQYVLHTTGSHEYDAKVSSGEVKLPGTILDPDLGRIIKKLEASSTVESTQETQ